MKIHLLSDIHIEHGRIKTLQMPSISADVCILAGDIGLAKKDEEYFNFLTTIKKDFNHVLLVLGNHEFYHMNYITALNKLKEIADSADVKLMDIYFGSENITIDNVKFWGTTLWTDFNADDWMVKQKVGLGLNDFHVIDGFTTETAYVAHVKSLKRINWDADVVITHHAPILQRHSKFGINDISYGFCCTGLDKRIIKSKIKYWFYGHTHDNRYNDLGGTIVASNQVGYGMEKLSIPYDSKFIITL